MDGTHAAKQRPNGEPVTLAQMAPGSAGVVTGVEGHDAVAVRLRDLGFLADTRVSVVRRAPLRDPSLYELRGYQIALRRTEAARIQVHPDAAARAEGG